MKTAILQVADSVVEYLGIPGLPDHQVGSDGSIWSRSRFGPKNGERRGEWRRLKQMPDKDGYLRVTLCSEGVMQSPRGVHSYVLLAFIGPCPDGMECCHEDGNPANNQLSNLRYGTRSGNNMQKRDHGTDQSGERGGNHKLSFEDVKYIRSQEGAYYGVQAVLARKYNIHRDTVRKIWSGVLWGNGSWE